MLKDFQARSSRIMSRASRWDEVIERLEQLDADDESGALDLAPTLVEIRALTREVRARAEAYNVRPHYGDDGAFVTPDRALAYLAKRAEELRLTVAGCKPSPDFVSKTDAEYALREVIDATAVLLRGDGNA